MLKHLLVIASLTACATHGDPLAPSAAGTLRLAPNTDTTAFGALELHWAPVDGTYGPETSDVLRREDTPFVFPMEFEVGFHFGASDATTYRLSAWFSNADEQPTEEPADGAPHATIDLSIGDCTDGCSTIGDVELELAR